MSRRYAPLLFSLSTCFGAFACGTDAVGVDACLKIEKARCDAARHCGLAEELACDRHVEVQCLHGFSKSALPNDRQASQCANALGQLAECADRRGSKVSVTTCELELGRAQSERACELVSVPHELRACEFLTPPGEEDEEEAEEDDEQSEPQPDAGSTNEISTTDAGSVPD